MPRLHYIDLFAGIGGFRHGIDALQDAHPEFECVCVATVEIKKDALDSYNLTFGESHPPRDVFGNMVCPPVVTAILEALLLTQRS